MPGHIWGYRFSLDLPNLKTSMLTTTFDDFTMDDLNRTLSYYPKLVSMKLIIKDVFSFVMIESTLKLEQLLGQMSSK